MLLLLLMMMGVMILVRYLISRGCQNKLKINSSTYSQSHFILGLNPMKCSRHMSAKYVHWSLIFIGQATLYQLFCIT